MAAKINTTKTISLKDGSMGPNGSGLTVPRPGSVLGGGTRMAGSSAGFKTKNDKGGGDGFGVKSSGFGSARGVAKRTGTDGSSSGGSKNGY